MMQALVNNRQISVDAGSLAFELPKNVQQMICDNISGTKRVLMPQAVKKLKMLCEEKQTLTPDDVERAVMQFQPEKKNYGMNGIPQPFTEEFIAASLLGFDSIDTYLQTFRYLFPCMSLNSH